MRKVLFTLLLLSFALPGFAQDLPFGALIERYDASFTMNSSVLMSPPFHKYVLSLLLGCEVC